MLKTPLLCLFQRRFSVAVEGLNGTVNLMGDGWSIFEDTDVPRMRLLEESEAAREEARTGSSGEEGERLSVSSSTAATGILLAFGGMSMLTSLLALERLCALGRESTPF